MTTMSTEPGNDPIVEFQRWLMKAGTRSLGRDVADRVRSTLGGGNPSDDVWGTATTEAPGGEPPECQWCPICRAARKYRESGGGAGGLGPSLAAAGDTLAGLAQEAVSFFEAAMRAQQRPADPASGEGTASDDGTIVGPGVAWPTVVHPEDEQGEAPDERGDADKGGEPGHAPPDEGGEQ